MALGTSHQTVTTGANFIPEIWSKELQVAREANLVAARLVKRFDSDVKQKGDVIHVPIVSNLSASDKSAETAVTFSSPTESKIDITINKHKHIAFIIEDILDAQQAYNTQEEYKSKIAYGLAKQTDTDVLALYTNLTNSVGTAGIPPTSENFLRAIRYLDDADAPTNDRSLIMAPSLKETFLSIDKFTNQDYSGIGDIPVKTGLIGQRYGVLFYVSTNVPTSGGNPVNQLIQKEAYALAMQKDIVIKSDYVIDFLGTAYVGQALYGVAAYRTDHGVQVLS